MYTRETAKATSTSDGLGSACPRENNKNRGKVQCPGGNVDGLVMMTRA
jgi:hypothetical protein